MTLQLNGGIASLQEAYWVYEHILLGESFVIYWLIVTNQIDAEKKDMWKFTLNSARLWVSNHTQEHCQDLNPNPVMGTYY